MWFWFLNFGVWTYLYFHKRSVSAAIGHGPPWAAMGRHVRNLYEQMRSLKTSGGVGFAKCHWASRTSAVGGWIDMDLSTQGKNTGNQGLKHELRWNMVVSCKTSLAAILGLEWVTGEDLYPINGRARSAYCKGGNWENSAAMHLLQWLIIPASVAWSRSVAWNRDWFTREVSGLGLFLGH